MRRLEPITGTERLPGSPGLYQKPRPINPGRTFKHKVIVKHKSDVLLQEQVENVQNVQEALNSALKELEEAENDEERNFHIQQIHDLKRQSDLMVLVLQIVSRINLELSYARLDLSKQLNEGSSPEINRARKRIGWLEDRMERLLEKKEGSGKEDVPRSMFQRLSTGYSSDVSQSLLADTDSDISPLFRKQGQRPLLPTMQSLQLGLGDDSLPNTRERRALLSGGLGGPEGTFLTLYPNSGDTSPAFSSVSDDHQDTAQGKSMSTETRDEPTREQHTQPPEKMLRTSSELSVKEQLLTGVGVDKDDKVQDPVIQQAIQYWLSEHHRFQYSQHAGAIVGENPTSYHTMGLAVRGSFITDDDTVKLTKSAKQRMLNRPLSELSDVHKLALDKLTIRIHAMYEKVKEASMLSVRPEYTNVSALMQIDEVSVEESKKAKKPKEVATPMDDKAMNVRKGPMVFHPKPLPPAITLPTARLDRSEQYPPVSEELLAHNPFLLEAPPTLVDQRNLYNETKFMSSLYKPRVKKKPEQSKESNETDRKDSQPRDLVKVSLKTALDFSEAVVKFQGGKWKEMKPRSGALKHAGLKWERVKDLVHNGLVSVYTEQRIDTCRQLGQLRCTDTMVLYALRQTILKDQDKRVVYEAAKSLIMLGGWDIDSLHVVMHYLLHGNTHVRADLLRTVIFAKNVQFVDKKMEGFDDLVKVLSAMCTLSDDPEDRLSFDAAMCLGRLCVADKEAKNRMLRLIQHSKDTNMKAEALDILVRQLNHCDADVLDAISMQINTSKVWKFRLDALKLISFIGPKRVLADHDTADKIYTTVERKLWDDPNKMVLHEAAKTLAALDLYAVACERVERRLNDPDDDVRAQAAQSIGSLGMNTGRIVHRLLEMLELDTSIYVRKMVIRTMATLQLIEKRVVRALKEKEKGDNIIASEAKKALTLLQMTS